MHILFIQTGGTIDKDYPKRIKGYNFEIGEPAIIRIMEKAKVAFTFTVKELLKKDSLDITTEDRKQLAVFCVKTKYKNIIITHGTDTMIETAKSLSAVKNKTIIFTGAFKPERFTGSDADFNLGTAIGAMHFVPQGVYLAINGMVYRYNEVKRDKKTGQFIKIN